MAGIARNPMLAAPASTGSGTTAARIDRPHAAWSIVLGTFTGPDHGEARDAAAKLGEHPGVRRRYRPQHRPGSMLSWGQFARPEDPALKIRPSGRTSTGRPSVREHAMIVRPGSDAQAADELTTSANLRPQFPRVDPALRSGRGGPTSTARCRSREIRRGGEGTPPKFPRPRLQAWFHHDDDLKMSVVTGHLRPATHTTRRARSSAPKFRSS